MSIRRTFRILLGAAVLTGLLAGCPAPERTFPHAVLTPKPAKAPVAVTLTGMDGKPFALSDLKGRWVWLYFGFTHCPDVCPAAMDFLAQEHKLLAQPARVVPLLVSVDPKRDDAATLKRYATYYGPAFRAATGDKAAIDALAKSVGAAYVIDPPKPNGDYNVSHTNLIFVLDPEGRFFAGYVPTPESGELAKDFNALPPTP